ncbi:MAG: VWA-like domain-containing protein [Pseudomonadota bacterium]
MTRSATGSAVRLTHSHSTRAAAALARLPEVDPALAALSLWCAHRDGPGKTHTTGDVISYGAAFPLLPISEQIGVLAHHVLHVALRHSARRGEMEQRLGPAFAPDLFDLACDALVNDVLLQAGHALPRPAVRATDLIAHLPPGDRPDNVVAQWDCEKLYFAMTASLGSRGGESGEAFRRYAIEKRFEPDLQKSDVEEAEAELWAGRVTQALGAGRSAGSGIGAVLTGFGDLPQAGIPWEIRLRRLMKKALAHHPRLSHSRPARAWLARDAWAHETGRERPVFEPALVQDNRRPRIVAGIDTSSSITDVELGLFAAEAVSLARRSGAEAHLLGFDTEVHFQGMLDRQLALARARMRRGGGTDFEPVLEEAQALAPSLIVILTDLDAPLPERPAAPVIWLVPEPPRVPPTYGEVLMMR